MLNQAQITHLEAYLAQSLFSLLDEDPTLDAATRFAAYQSLWQLFENRDHGYLKKYTDDFTHFLFTDYQHRHNPHDNLFQLLDGMLEIYLHPTPQNPAVSYDNLTEVEQVELSLRTDEVAVPIYTKNGVRVSAKDKEAAVESVMFVKKGFLGLINENECSTAPVCKLDIHQYFAARFKEKAIAALAELNQERAKRFIPFPQQLENEKAKEKAQAQSKWNVAGLFKKTRTEVKSAFNHLTQQIKTKVQSTTNKTPAETEAQSASVKPKLTFEDAKTLPAIKLDEKINLGDYRPSRVALPTAVALRRGRATSDKLKVCIISDAFNTGKRFSMSELPKYLKQFPERQGPLTKEWTVDNVDFDDVMIGQGKALDKASLDKIRDADMFLLFQQGPWLDVAFKHLEVIVADAKPMKPSLFSLERGKPRQSMFLKLAKLDDVSAPKHYQDATPNEAFKIAYRMCRLSEENMKPQSTFNILPKRRMSMSPTPCA